MTDIAAELEHLFAVHCILPKSIFNEKFAPEILLVVNNIFNDEEDDNITHFKELCEMDWSV